jgi:broad specificity phosphatase PhoE
MRLFAMRHGETDWNRQRKIQGLQDIGLNDSGREQIRQTCVTLADRTDLRFARIVTSPLMRAVESAAICRDMLQVPVEIMDHFRERSFGRLEGKTLDEIREHYGIDDIEEMQSARYRAEAMAAVRERIRQGLCVLMSNYPNQDILLVTHGSIIKCLAGEYSMETGILPNGAFIVLHPHVISVD